MALKFQERREICASNGITYINDCELKASACKNQIELYKLYDGVCDKCAHLNCNHGTLCEDEVCKCPTKCSDTYQPVCASDGSTFQNECHFKKAICSIQDDLQILYFSECQEIKESETGNEGLSFTIRS